jgi:hypothetical protein
MKCINCETDNNLKDRTANSGKCSNCNHAFVFEPTSMETIKITDPLFAKVISDISVNNTLFFTPKQMLYFLDKRFRRKGFNPTSFAVIFILVHVFLFAIVPIVLIYQLFHIINLYRITNSPKLDNASRKASTKSLSFVGIFVLAIGMFNLLLSIGGGELYLFLIFVVEVLFGMTAIYLSITQLSKTRIPQELLIPESAVQDWLNRWQQTNGNILKLLPQPQDQNQFATINPDVTAYSFDRLIVCDRADIAQFLIANNFHFENNCAILSITGYPQSIFQTTMDMLRRNPDLKVYALHDCTPKGLGLTHHLRTSSAWFQNINVAIIDIGISPRQVLATKKGIFVETSPQSATDAKQLTSEIRQELSPEEIQWLDAGNIVNLESFQPQKLLEIIQRGIVNTRTLGSDNNDLIIIGGASTFIYATESFG